MNSDFSRVPGSVRMATSVPLSGAEATSEGSSIRAEFPAADLDAKYDPVRRTAGSFAHYCLRGSAEYYSPERTPQSKDSHIYR